MGYLHSTMFLLIRFMDDKTVSKVLYLHSTMFLLIHSEQETRIGGVAIYIPQCFY